MKTLRELATASAADLLNYVQEIVDERDALLDERDALKADAARYRLLTKHFLGWFSRTSPLPWQKQTKKDALDKALDAAIAAGAKP